MWHIDVARAVIVAGVAKITAVCNRIWRSKQLEQDEGDHFMPVDAVVLEISKPLAEADKVVGRRTSRRSEAVVVRDFHTILFNLPICRDV